MNKPAAPTPPAWDEEAALRATGGDAAFLDELVAVYLKDAARGASRMRRLERAARFEDLAKEAHRLKGSSLTLRLGALGAVCREIEAAAENRSAARLSRRIERFGRELDRFRRFWKERKTT
ncbi:MAG: Hpt domain-containing protein [Candidatus Aminicenantes bacterium]|nr:Hpt domain-containing protein [Candidatus Aminicenantes bacterium]